MTKQTYNQLRAQLDDVLVRLQSADCTVDDALKLFEQGQSVSKELQDVLEKAENTVTTLSKQAV